MTCASASPLNVLHWWAFLIASYHVNCDTYFILLLMKNRRATQGVSRLNLSSRLILKHLSIKVWEIPKYAGSVEVKSELEIYFEASEHQGSGDSEWFLATVKKWQTYLCVPYGLVSYLLCCWFLHDSCDSDVMFHVFDSCLLDEPFILCDGMVCLLLVVLFYHF